MTKTRRHFHDNNDDDSNDDDDNDDDMKTSLLRGIGVLLQSSFNPDVCQICPALFL